LVHLDSAKGCLSIISQPLFDFKAQTSGAHSTASNRSYLHTLACGGPYRAGFGLHCGCSWYACTQPRALLMEESSRYPAQSCIPLPRRRLQGAHAPLLGDLGGPGQVSLSNLSSEWRALWYRPVPGGPGTWQRAVCFLYVAESVDDESWDPHYVSRLVQGIELKVGRWRCRQC
jgi:hypothetical protein